LNKLKDTYMIFKTMTNLLSLTFTVYVLGYAAMGHAVEVHNTDLERFLPNHGNSVFNAAGLLRRWPPTGPKELWRVEIGWGKTAVLEADGRAFTAICRSSPPYSRQAE
jgi:hypothetical protein